MLCSGDQHTVPKKNHDGGDRQISLAGWVPQSTGCSSRSPTHHHPHLCSPSCAPTRLKLLYVLYVACSSSACGTLNVSHVALDAMHGLPLACGFASSVNGVSSQSAAHPIPRLGSPSSAPTQSRLLHVLYGAWSSSGVSCSLGHQSAGPPPLGGGRGGLFGASFPGPPLGGFSGGLFGASFPGPPLGGFSGGLFGACSPGPPLGGFSGGLFGACSPGRPLGGFSGGLFS
jgi:hypothetical protein